MSVVELTWLCDLSLAAEWRIAPAQMRQCRSVGVPVEYLRHASFCGHRLLLISPISGSERILKAISDSIVFYCQVEIEVLVRFHALEHLMSTFCGSRAYFYPPFADDDIRHASIF